MLRTLSTMLTMPLVFVSKAKLCSIISYFLQCDRQCAHGYTDEERVSTIMTQRVRIKKLWASNATLGWEAKEHLHAMNARLATSSLSVRPSVFGFPGILGAQLYFGAWNLAHAPNCCVDTRHHERPALDVVHAVAAWYDRCRYTSIDIRIHGSKASPGLAGPYVYWRVCLRRDGTGHNL